MKTHFSNIFKYIKNIFKYIFGIKINRTCTSMFTFLAKGKRADVRDVVTEIAYFSK